MMVVQWQGEDLLVKLSTVVSFCCDSGVPPGGGGATSGYHRRGQVMDEPHPVIHRHPWTHLLQNYRLESSRYTIVPTITVVSPWDLDTQDQVFSGSDPINHAIYPTPTPTTPSLHARDATLNATQRIYDALQVVLHGSASGTLPVLGDEPEASVSDTVFHHVQETFHPHVVLQEHPHGVHIAGSPLLQVCAALAVLVVVLVVLFHMHHFRQDCMVERRALRRVAQTYEVSGVRQHHADVENNVADDVSL
ncbi:uncharacterized protein [Cherax quadricarinatus]|uniref:uncharacterized protein isoform X2 n=1 Tax=Cherax quadricarinatus TaxID=27406 RepID=UPI00387EC509